MNKTIKTITAGVVAVVAILRTGELGLLCITGITLTRILINILTKVFDDE